VTERRTQKVVEHYLYRMAFGLLLPFSQVVIIRGMLLETLGPPWLFLSALVALLLSLGMWFNLKMFPWRYSVFGPLQRTPPPSSTPIESHEAIGTRFSNKLSIALAKWSFFPGGAEISTIGGRVWLPRESVTDVQSQSRRLVIFHSCCEVRSPITVFFLWRAEDQTLMACLLATFARTQEHPAARPTD
jgi:hypothetical protein